MGSYMISLDIPVWYPVWIPTWYPVQIRKWCPIRILHRNLLGNFT